MDFVEYKIRVVWDGPRIRQISLLEDNKCIKQDRIEDGLITEPCNPRCEGLVSFCCGLVEEDILFDSYHIKGSTHSLIVYKSLLMYMKSFEE